MVKQASLLLRGVAARPVNVSIPGVIVGAKVLDDPQKGDACLRPTGLTGVAERSRHLDRMLDHVKNPLIRAWHTKRGTLAGPPAGARPRFRVFPLVAVEFVQAFVANPEVMRDLVQDNPPDLAS
jgi:hypothetical protein